MRYRLDPEIRAYLKHRVDQERRARAVLDGFCKECQDPIGPPRREFCSDACAIRFYDWNKRIRKRSAAA